MLLGPHRMLLLRRANRTLPTALRCPPAGSTTPNKTPPGLQLVLPSQLKPCKNMCVSSAERRHPRRLCTSRVVVAAREERQQNVPACGSRAAPTPSGSHSSSGAVGSGGPGLPAPSTRSAPLRSPRTPPAAARSAPPKSPGTGTSGAGHGGHAARPVPAGVTCPSGSRARAAANRGERCPRARRLW